MFQKLSKDIIKELQIRLNAEQIISMQSAVIQQYKAKEKLENKNNIIAHINTQVTHSDPAKTSRIDAKETSQNDARETSRIDAKVNLDASKSKDMYNKPCVSYEWDFGDNTNW